MPKSTSESQAQITYLLMAPEPARGRHGPKIGGSVFFRGGGAGSPSNTMSLVSTPTYIPSGILIYPAVWAKNWVGWVCPFSGVAGSPSNTKSPGPRPTSIPSGMLIHAAIWQQQIWAENWGLCPFRGAGAGSPSNTMWPGPRPTCMSSFILIHPTVWPQCTNVTDSTDRQKRQQSDSIGRTV